MPEAGRVAPISDSVWCLSTFDNSFNANVTDVLEVAFGCMNTLLPPVGKPTRNAFQHLHLFVRC